MRIGEVIKDLRIERGLSQKKLANAIGVSQKAIDYWERGVNEPKASYIVLLADYFGVSCDFLLSHELQAYPKYACFILHVLILYLFFILARLFI